MKTILITGASSGIGRACAEIFSGKANIILCSRDTTALKGIASGLVNSQIYAIDVRNESAIQTMFKDLEDQLIYPDIVINAAGLALGLENLEDGSPEEWSVMLDTNIKGTLLVSKYALIYMKKLNRGHIINLGSIAGITPYAKGVVYSASKAAVKSISDGLRKEAISHEIKITNIQPGLVETNFSNVRFHGDTEKAQKVYEGIRPLAATDIADIIYYVIQTPPHVQINEITVTPVHQATVEMIYRKT